MSTRRGWVCIDAQTSVCLHQGQPVRVRARLLANVANRSAQWLDTRLRSRLMHGVAERATQWVGAPLKLGEWKRVDGVETWEAECGLAEPELGNKEWN